MGKGFMFFLFVWLVVTIAGSVMVGSVSIASTILTESIETDTTTIPVGNTINFPAPGTIIIDDERISYPKISGTSFIETVGQPVLRGAENTEAASHTSGAVVRQVEGGMMNTAVAYNIAVIADASGLWAALNIGLALMRILGSFLILPTSFLGTDLAILGIIWWVCAAGMIFSVGLALAGGRRVG